MQTRTATNSFPFDIFWTSPFPIVTTPHAALTMRQNLLLTNFTPDLLLTLVTFVRAYCLLWRVGGIYGCVLYQGHPAGDSGHYTCYFKDQYQNQWFYANDSYVGVKVVKILLVQKLNISIYMHAGVPCQYSSCSSARYFLVNL